MLWSPLLFLPIKQPMLLKKSIKSALAQSYTDVEVVVVDDNGLGIEPQRETEDVIDVLKPLEGFIL